MKTGYCFLSAVPVRKEPSHSSEMVNQLLYGDRVEILDCKPEWLFTRSLFDGYEGWVSDKQLIDGNSIENESFVVPADNCIISNDIKKNIPAGSQCNENKLINKAMPQRDIVGIARLFLGTPYLWGGRTSAGIDCSGLVQVVYKICGINLPRDASQQVQHGEHQSFDKSKSGDLAFFANQNGRVIHVGIVVGDGTIIHASGMVRQDQLDKTGIYNAERRQYTHYLHDIRRYTK